MDASYKIQRGIHVHLIQFFMCPEFWVHIITGAFPLYICSKRKNDRVYCGKELFLMKHMTNTQIDEINRLLTDHREALTAFWDEAFYYGMRSGYKWVLCGAAIAVVAMGVGETVIRIRNKRKNEKES